MAHRQCRQVYASENAFLKECGNRRFDSIADMGDYMRTLMASPWFQRRWPGKRTLIIRDGRGLVDACCWDAGGGVFYLSFPRWARTKYVALHEIAHICTLPWSPAHDGAFCATLLQLVRREIGVTAAKLLRVEFDRRAVLYQT